MEDPKPEAEGAEVLDCPEATAPADAARPAADGRCKLSVGTRWRGFHVEGLAPGGPALAFEATNIGLMEKVLIVANPVTRDTEWRKGAWQKLCAHMPADARILGCIETFAEDGWRYEVMNRPPATTLREWMSSHQADSVTRRLVLEQLAKTLGAMHAQGVVHLNVRPETIYIEEKGPNLEITVGGLEVATLYNHSGLVVAEVNPLYAPPEAVDPAGIRPGIGLCAWDWWMLGRVVQEMVLGRHVMSVMFGRDVIREMTPPLRAQAEALLLEREPPGVRAGAVEAMTGLDEVMDTLLRGLLTTARDARWGGEMVRRWLAKEKVGHHYDLARDARFFTWNGRGFSLSEAIEHFCREENWADGEEHIFNASNPETLANFLANVPEHEADWQKLQRILALAESPEWSGVPAPACRTATTALAWLALGTQPRSLVLRGRRVDAPGLTELLRDAQNFYNCENVKALMSAPSLAFLKPLDAVAADVLSQLVRVGLEALRRAEPLRWWDPSDPGGEAEVLRLALEPAASLRTRADRVRSVYATNQNPELARMVEGSNREPWAEVILIITAADPRRHGYVTKAEHGRQQLAGMQARSQQLHRAVVWLRVKQMLGTGGPCTGRWRAFVSSWLAVVGLGVAVARDLETTFWLATGLVGLRLLFSWRVRTLVNRCDPVARPWSWRDGPRRCVDEARQAWPEARADALPGLTRQLATMEKDIAALAPADTMALPPVAPWLTPLRVGVAAGTFLCLMGSLRLVLNSGNAVRLQIANYTQGPAEAARSGKMAQPGPLAPGPDTELLATMPGLSAEMRQKVAQGEYEIVEETFGPVLHGPLTKWNLAPPAVPSPLPVADRVQATASQRAYALVSAELLLQPYPRKGVNALLVVRVPVQDKFGVMLYNARDHLLVDNDTLVMRERLTARTWYKFENRTLIYLGQPTGITRENSLALR